MSAGKIIGSLLIVGMMLACLSCKIGGVEKNPIWYEDQDHDGYTSGNVLQNSFRPEGYVSESELKNGLIDCNDNNNYIHPEGREAPDDGVDQDCTGYDLKTWYHDGDKDGYSEMAPGVQSETEPYPENDDYFLKNALYAIGTDMDDTDPHITIEADDCCAAGERVRHGNVYVYAYSDLKELEGYTEIEGQLIITMGGRPAYDSYMPFYFYGDGSYLPYNEDEDIVHLHSLRCLKKIGRDLLIVDTPQLRELKGLANLTAVGGDLIILNSSRITNMEGLDNLTAIGGSLIITDNHDLAACGLDHLAEIGGDLKLWRNPALENISGLNRLNHVAGGMELLNNKMLTSVSGPDYAHIHLNGGLQVAGNMRLNTIDPMADLHVTGDVIVQNNSLVEETDVVDLLDQMKAHGRIDGAIHVADNHTDDGVDTTWQGDVTIKTGEDMGGLDHITHITGTLSIENVPSISGLDALKRIDGDVVLTHNKMKTLAGLDNLTSIGGSLYIFEEDNAGGGTLSTLTGLDGVNVVGGSLLIRNNASLRDLDGLGNLASVGGHIIITGNPSLKTVSGLEGVAMVANPVWRQAYFDRLPIPFFDDNPSHLYPVSHFDVQGFYSKKPDIYIAENDALIGIDGFDPE